MDYKDFIKNYKKGETKLYLLYGTETLLINWAVNELIKQNISPGFEAVDFVKLDGKNFDIDVFVNACETIPLMSKSRVILIDEFNSLDGSKGKKLTEADEKRFVEAVESLAERTLVIVTCNNKVDKRKKVYKSIVKNGEIYDFVRLPLEDLKKWIVKRVKGNDKVINNVNLSKLIELSGYFQKDSDYTLYNFENDISKIVSLAANQETIEEKHILDAISGNIERNVFAIVDAVSEGRKSEALRIFSNALTFGEAEYKILALLNRQFELLLRVKIMSESGQNISEIKSKLKLQDFVVKKLLRLARNFTIESLKKINKEMYEADKNIKTGILSPTLSLEIFIANI